MSSKDALVSAQRPKSKSVPSWLVTKDWGLDDLRVSDKFVTKSSSRDDKGRGNVPPESFVKQKKKSITSPSASPSSSTHLAAERNADGSSKGRRASHGGTEESFRRPSPRVDESSEPAIPRATPGGMPHGIPEEHVASVPSSKPSPQTPPASSFDADSSRVAVERRRSRLYSEISQPKIQIPELRRLAMTGIPEDGRLRATVWKLLLGYLPRTTEDWEGEVAKRRAEYVAFRKDLIFTPTEVMRRKDEAAARHAWMRQLEEADSAEMAGMAESAETAEMAEGAAEELRGRGMAESDHPLSTTPHSIWHQHFKDAELAEQIDRDVKRTHPDIEFFNGANNTALEVQDSMRRLLFIFAKLNPGIRYVQGMNEVLAPLLFVFANDLDNEAVAHAEPDAFFCFSILLGDFRDHFCSVLDNSAVGIRSTIGRLAGLLREHDYELWEHLEIVNKVNPQFYAFRWITLLLTQDFPFDNILRLWDSILANSSGPMEILLRICCAMLICVRDRLLAGDFATNLKMLQKYPSVDLEHIIRTAESFKL